MKRMFPTEAAAKAYFGDIDVEECECCGQWTASFADTDEGGIIGACCDPAGDAIYDRICEDCDESLDFSERKTG